MKGLSAKELAWQAGTTTEQIEKLVTLGILEPDEHGRFRPGQLHLVRLAEAMLQAGVTLDDMATLVAEGKYSFDYIEDVFPQAAPPMLEQTFKEAAQEVGLSLEIVEQLYTNWSLPPPDPQQRVRTDDEEILRGRGRLRSEFELDDESIVAASRFFGENLRRMAESQVRFFRTRVIDGLRAKGLTWVQVLQAIGPIAAGMRGGSDQLRALLYDRHLENYIFQEAVEIFEEALAEAGYRRPRPAHPPAIAFLDMGGYTLLTQKAGDEAAAELAGRLGGLVHRASQGYGGRAVKSLGDGVMFYFPQAAPAVACGLELVEAAEREGLPPARVGVNVGQVVFRDGDYFGQTVNVAARITDYARPREVLVSQATLEELEDEPLEFEPIGEIALKGVREPVALYRALNRHDSGAE